MVLPARRGSTSDSVTVWHRALKRRVPRVFGIQSNLPVPESHDVLKAKNVPAPQGIEHWQPGIAWAVGSGKDRSGR
jgi:hypothetical protein